MSHWHGAPAKVHGIALVIRAGGIAMPFPMIPAALSVCFLLVWAFIGGMIFRDSQLAVEDDREADVKVLPLMHRPRTWHRQLKRDQLRQRQPTIRAAS
jgi:hypothetical protein